MFELNPMEFSGLYTIGSRFHTDERGSFMKTLHRDWFENHGLQWNFREQYFSTSHANVIRGMHFQKPPSDHEKLVYCVHGQVMDVVVDLRRASSTYGQATSLRLSADSGQMVYIPRGMAHGFCAISDHATLVYNVTSVYDPDADSGIHWDSFKFEWPTRTPILSARDRGFLPLGKFQSPF